MTAEIAVLNKEAIALAADSAVTMSGPSGRKIFQSANKIFALSKRYPVGIMVFGNANFMDVPWETIIKKYRSSLGEKGFDDCEDYAKDFFSYLTKASRLFPASQQDKYFSNTLESYFTHLRTQIIKKVQSRQEQAGSIDEEQVRLLVSERISALHEKLGKYTYLPKMDAKFEASLATKYRLKIEEIRGKVFEQLPLSETDSLKLKDIAVEIFCRMGQDVFHSGISGVVIAGFGHDDIFPRLYAYYAEGIVRKRVKYFKSGEQVISHDSASAIMPFAQDEMVCSFMEGVVPGYEKEIERYLNDICHEYPKAILDSIVSLAEEERNRIKENLGQLSEEWLKNYKKRLDTYRTEHFVDPVINVVSVLPKDELATMAETLVNLTSFRKKVTIEEETVGGPIDVAVISRGDGFIWIKRKHYFKPDLNQNFFSNYRRH
ncbi:MAG TPA: hypothetical protein P5119_06750 [Candidatus Aminicenantes bacterium]|nr:hypothetical protein [Candidatus Aminicenantes bacterium]HRY65027.1 hypothetical protein [Candidatus Aminicenantes bacterium]HRZ71940.1 hypothetical protein [Candidatus Aminicenantes bacterium]